MSRPLTCVYQESQNDTLKQLLDEGAAPNQVLEHGNRLLAISVQGIGVHQRFNERQFQLLTSYGANLSASVREGADPTIEDNEGVSAIECMKRFRD